MKVGLVRHFEVTVGIPDRQWLTPRQIAQWLADYERADVIPGTVDLGGIAWARCISSDSPRAAKTARAIYPGPVDETPILREAALRPIARANVALPFPFWTLVLRLAWMTSHKSQIEAKTAFLRNVKTFANEVLPRLEDDTLVVGHAGFMIFLRKELLRQGFRGPKFSMPENGRLYVFERR